jgi:hypothetical protein
MNNSDLIKLGLPPNNRELITEFQEKVELTTPLSINSSVKDSRNYDTQVLKNINIGTLKNPKDLLTVHVNGSNTYYPVTGGAPYYFAKKDYYISTNGNLDTYTSFLGEIDLENPYDPINFSFQRLYSLTSRIFNSGRLTGINGSVTGYISSTIVEGDKELFYRLTSGSILGNNIYNGFFKKAASRQSKFKYLVLASGNNSSGLMINTDYNTSTADIPNHLSYVTYPQTYNQIQYKQFDCDTIIIPSIQNNLEYTSSGFNGVLVISTGYDKNIVYVSPHTVDHFSGFSYISGARSQRYVASTGIRKSVFLQSGKFIGLNSKGHNFTGLHAANTAPTGIGTLSQSYYYNAEQVRLKQSTPIIDTAFYKLFEKVYKINSFNTGTWDGIIPKGTPFTIETVRGSDSFYGSNKISFNIYAKDYFQQTTTGYYNSQTVPESGIYGSFWGTALEFSDKSENVAQYISNLEAFKKARSKLIGTLWDKGFSTTNSKVRKVVKLFNGASWPDDLYCEQLSDGTIICASGILTSAGIRVSGGNLIRSRNPLGISGFKYTKTFNTVNDIPSGAHGKFFISNLNKIVPV